MFRGDSVFFVLFFLFTEGSLSIECVSLILSMDHILIDRFNFNRQDCNLVYLSNFINRQRNSVAETAVPPKCH